MRKSPKSAFRKWSVEPRIPGTHVDTSTSAITNGGIVEPGSPWPLVLIGADLALAAVIGVGLAWSRGLLPLSSSFYVVIAIGKLPRFQLDRAGAALLGATLMVACGAISLSDAYKAIDFGTITLLLGMMIVIANLRLSGFFRLINSWAVTRAHHPIILLGAVVLVTGVLSAFLVNDAICLVMAPIIIELTRALKRNPVPYLIAVALALQRRQHGNDHRQSAEHDHRQPFAHSI
jgi:di/tricarboxylate transporter